MDLWMLFLVVGMLWDPSRETATWRIDSSSTMASVQAPQNHANSSGPGGSHVQDSTKTATFTACNSYMEP